MRCSRLPWLNLAVRVNATSQLTSHAVPRNATDRVRWTVQAAYQLPVNFIVCPSCRLRLHLLRFVVDLSHNTLCNKLYDRSTTRCTAQVCIKSKAYDKSTSSQHVKIFCSLLYDLSSDKYTTNRSSGVWAIDHVHVRLVCPFVSSYGLRTRKIAGIRFNNLKDYSHFQQEGFLSADMCTHTPKA